jgi:hypothetical protein
MVALAAIYAVWALVLQPKPKADAGGGTSRGGQDQELLVEWIAQIRSQILVSTLSPGQQERIKRATQPWPDDLILTAKLPSELIAEEQARLAEIKRKEEERLAKLAAASAASTSAQNRIDQMRDDLRKRFRYSGYVYQGGGGNPTLCAIVNGVVYKPGEKLDRQPYEVVSISTDEIVIRSTKEEPAIELHIPITQ